MSGKGQGQGKGVRSVRLTLSPKARAWLELEAGKRYGRKPGGLSLVVSSILEDLYLWRTATDSETVLARLNALRPWVEALGGVIVHRNPVVSRELTRKPDTEE